MKAIEMLGLPGSGKSTITNILSKDPQNNIITHEEYVINYFSKKNILISLFSKTIFKKFFFKYYINKNRISYLTKFLINDSSVITFILSSICFASQSKKEKQLVLSWFLKLIVIFQISSKDESHDYHLFDEGFIHKLLSLFISPRDIDKINLDLLYNEIDKYLEIIPIPEILIFIEIDPLTSMRRLQKRGLTFRTKKLSSNDLESYIKLQNNVMQYILDKLLKYDCRIFKVNNNGNSLFLKKQLKDLQF